MEKYNETDVMKSTRESAGADEKTPSKSQYFSWINSTNEGSSEKQTLANLDYFKWLRDEYGMQLDIYAWDAGNLDGSMGTYETLDSPKLKKQFPNGYAPVAKAASDIGTQLGVWCGPDGFGNTPEEEAARHELMVSLCRDYNFGLFKMDAVCSDLREEKQDAFINMMKECRKYSPELVLLNHRLDLGRAKPYATTFLLGGEETYIDVHMVNKKCAPHHREYTFHRLNADDLTRLTEDHGVCISSCIDYFEDELVYQAFNHCLILAPEIYGNPWLMRDEEHARMARIYNLHRKYRDILVDGVELPITYGWHHALSRGSKSVRFVTASNPYWETQKIAINLNGEIGLERCDGDIVVSIHHPYEQYVGHFRYGDRVEIDFPPFRAMLIEVARAEESYPMLTNCSYEVLHESDGVPDKVKIYEVSGKIGKLVNGALTDAPASLSDIAPFDNREGVPVGIRVKWSREEAPANIEQIFETSQFIMDCDSFEAQSLKRSGETAVPQVKAARDAFFEQRTYNLRGCESRFAFDGKENTFFGMSVTPYGGNMCFECGGLRVDLGESFDVDKILIEYFDPEQDGVREAKRQNIVNTASYSTDLAVWSDSYLDEVKRVRDEKMDIVRTAVHNIDTISGARKQVTYRIGGKMRYFRLARPIDRIFKIAAIKDGCEITLTAPWANNLYPVFADRTLKGYRTTNIRIPEKLRYEDSFIAVGINGNHGMEGVYVVGELDGKLYGCPDRASSYQVNSWECPASRAEGPYTYYLPIAEEMKGREVKLHVLEMTDECTAIDIDVHLCEKHGERDGIISEF